MKFSYKYIFLLMLCMTQISCSSDSGSSDASPQPDPLLDTDGDGLTDTEEVNTYGTDPELADTDGDTFDDRVEVITQSNPLDNQIIPEHKKYIQEDLDNELDAKWINENGWTIANDLSCRTGNCLQSPLIESGAKSDISVDLVVYNGHFQYDITVANTCCNKVDLYVDDVIVKTYQNGDNLSSNIVLQDGLHRLKWVIDTQDIVEAGAVLIDNIRFAAFASSERNLSVWSKPDGLIFSNDLTSEAAVIGGSGRVVGTDVQFDAVRGVNPGDAGGLVFEDFQYPADLAGKGSITLDIEPAALAIDESEKPDVFSQSSGTPRNNIAPFLVATPMSGEDNEKIQWSRHENGDLAFSERSNAESEATANIGLNSLGKSDYAHLAISWQGNQLDFHVDGLLYKTLDRSAPATSEAFQKLYIGLYGGKSLGNFWIKNFNVYSEPVNFPKVPNTVGILGDSFTVAGFQQPFGIPRYDVSWGYQLQKYLANENMSATFYPGGKSGYGYSLTNSPNLNDPEVLDALLANNPEIVFCLGSVMDTLNGEYRTDYQQSWQQIITRLSSHASVKKIIVTSIPPFTKVPLYNTDAVKGAISQSNEVISQLPAFNEKVVYFDLFTAMGGFEYDAEWSIGSAVGTPSIADFNPSPKGHVRLAELLYSAIRANLE